MKTVKMSLLNLEGKLSRKELKGIMAGSGGGGTGICGQCFGIGSWYGEANWQNCGFHVSMYCSNGGYCYPC